ncbi:MAG: 4Fe-4S binding protein [Candidatus Omnitrophica bacterium]|nr:4Fe-4S binding protein [Candidatus Omnitrophota bacterium]
MKYPKLRELREAIKALITGPYTSSFPYRPHNPFERFRGKPEFNDKYCMGCGACTQVCPAGALTFEDRIDKKKASRILTYRMDLCIFCGQCQLNCPTEKGIVLSREFDFATTGKREDLKQIIEKELVLCDCCGETVAPYGQILWVARKIGPLTFSNASLMLFYLAHLRLSDTAVKRKDTEAFVTKKEFKRSDRIKILCPRCRREVVIKS